MIFFSQLSAIKTIKDLPKTIDLSRFSLYNSRMSFTISVDGACDTDYEQLKGFGVKYKKNLYKLDGEPTKDNLIMESDYDSLCASLDDGAVLSCVPLTRQGYEDFFDTILERGEKSIIHICVGSKIAKNHDECVRAVKMEMLKFPKTEIYVVDSGSFSVGLRPLIDLALRLRDEGLSAGETFIALNEKLSGITTLVAPSNLDKLVKNGLVPSSLVVGNSLSLLPLFEVKEGKFSLLSRSKGYASLSQKILKEAKNAKAVFVSHSGTLAPTRGVHKVAPTEISRMALFSTHLVGTNSVIIAIEKY